MTQTTSTTRTAVVTGAASGIGRAVAHRLAERGHHVALLDIAGDAVTRVTEELREKGATAAGFEVDVADRAGVRAAIEGARERLGPITIVVTCAGVEKFAPTVDISDGDWDRILAINLTGTFVPIQAALPDMLAAKWGRIVTISSYSAQSGAPNMAHYVASKGGVIALTKSLSFDFAPEGITANTIPPSIVDTPMARKAEAAGELRMGIDAIASLTPVRRAGTPEDIAATTAFLCSDEAGFITGQQINVNGGWYM